MASWNLTRMSVALQRSNAIIPLARCQRERNGPIQMPSQVEAHRSPARHRRGWKRTRGSVCSPADAGE